jgi:hypothetical protein
LFSGFSSKLRAIHGLLKTELPIAAGVCIVAEIISGCVPSRGEALLGYYAGFTLSSAAMISNARVLAFIASRLF